MTALGTILSTAGVTVDADVKDIAGGRITLTSGLPVTVADIGNSGTIYYTPYLSDRIGLYDGSNWAAYTFTEASLALTATINKPYDVWAYAVGSTVTLETLVWTWKSVV